VVGLGPAYLVGVPAAAGAAPLPRRSLISFSNPSSLSSSSLSRRSRSDEAGVGAGWAAWAVVALFGWLSGLSGSRGSSAAGFATGKPKSTAMEAGPVGTGWAARVGGFGWGRGR